jgi:hypothetical protein
LFPKAGPVCPSFCPSATNRALEVEWKSAEEREPAVVGSGVAVASAICFEMRPEQATRVLVVVQCRLYKAAVIIAAAVLLAEAPAE